MKSLSNICIIDDCAIDCFIAGKICKEAVPGAAIHTFYSVSEALHELIQLSVNHPEALPDIIFLDIEMPVADGWDFLESFRFIVNNIVYKPCQIYILSASINEKDVEKTKQYPFVDGFICKPISMSTMAAIIQSYSYY